MQQPLAIHTKRAPGAIVSKSDRVRVRQAWPRLISVVRSLSNTRTPDPQWLVEWTDFARGSQSPQPQTPRRVGRLKPNADPDPGSGHPRSLSELAATTRCAAHRDKPACSVSNVKSSILSSDRAHRQLIGSQPRNCRFCEREQSTLTQLLEVSRTNFAPLNCRSGQLRERTPIVRKNAI